MNFVSIKKIYITIGFSILIITFIGCSNGGNPISTDIGIPSELAKEATIDLESDKNDNELAIELSYKEKCAGYLAKEKDRFDSEDILLDGIYFSKKMNSCISKWLDYSDYTYRYFNVLTNEFLIYIRYTYDDVNADIELTDEKATEYEDSLVLIK